MAVVGSRYLVTFFCQVFSYLQPNAGRSTNNNKMGHGKRTSRKGKS
jgi:hypothetical protein